MASRQTRRERGVHTIEAGEIPEMPLGEGLMARFRGNPAQKHGRAEAEIVLGTFVDDGSGQSAIHSQCKVLFDRYEFRDVVLTVCYHFKTGNEMSKSF